MESICIFVSNVKSLTENCWVPANVVLTTKINLVTLRLLCSNIFTITYILFFTSDHFSSTDTSPLLASNVCCHALFLMF